MPFIFNDESTGSCICLRLDLYLSNVKIGARHLGSLCSILPFSHKKYPRQETVTYVASCIPGMFLVVPNSVARCHYVRKDARKPDGKIWKLRARRLAYKRRDVICEVRGTRLLYVIPSCKTHPCQFPFISLHERGRCSSVGITTGYGQDGAGIESRWERDFP
jgi:hypothetical protein